MGVMDSSFLFLPFGNDLLVVALVARHHSAWWIYVVSAVCGSTLGVFFLDMVARRIGEAGVQKVAGTKQFNYLKQKMGENGAITLIVGCLAPPPFPFTMAVATTSALGYPRVRLLSLVAMARTTRFVILSLLALKYGRAILHVMNTEAFRWTMLLFVFFCLAGSVFSIVKWARKGRTRRPAEAAA